MTGALFQEKEQFGLQAEKILQNIDIENQEV